MGDPITKKRFSLEKGEIFYEKCWHNSIDQLYDTAKLLSRSCPYPALGRGGASKDTIEEISLDNWDSDA